MNRRKIALGPGAASLILIAVMLALCMLSMLTLVTARNDEDLSIRSAEMIQDVYTLSASAEKRLAELDAVLAKVGGGETDKVVWLEKVAESLPEGMTIEEDIVSWTETLDNRWLDCQVQLSEPGAEQRTEWISHRLAVEEPEDDWEWD